MIKKYIKKLEDHVLTHSSGLPDGETVLGMLYECHNENCPYDNAQIKADFNELYRRMNGMELREMDKIIYPVCTLCRDHEKSGFIEGVKVGMLLYTELNR